MKKDNQTNKSESDRETDQSAPTPKDARSVLQQGGIEAVKAMFANVEPYDPTEKDKKPKLKSDTKEPRKSAKVDDEVILQKFCYDGRIFHMCAGGNDFVPVDRKSVECHLFEFGIEDLIATINRIQRERFVRHVGPYAGKMRGLYTEKGISYLITSEPAIIKPEKGSWSTLRAVIGAVMGNDEKVGDLQVTIFLLWLKVAYEALVAGVRIPGQALVLAGPKGSGKSLLIELIVEVLGGRRGFPHKYITGRTAFNGELLGSEVLVSDDDSGNTDIKTRRGVAASYKNLLFAGEVSIEAKFGTPRSCSPFWRLVIATNDEPESMLVLPPLSTDIADKITLICCVKRPMPMPSAKPEQRTSFFATLVGEIPALLFDLGMMEIPDELRDDRCAVAFFHHPTLLASLSESSPETQMLQLIDEALPMCKLCPGFLRPWEGTAAELRRELLACCSFKKDVERVLFSIPVTGSYLGRLATSGNRVQRLKLRDGVQRWRVLPAVSVLERRREFQANREADNPTDIEIEDHLDS